MHVSGDGCEQGTRRSLKRKQRATAAQIGETSDEKKTVEKGKGTTFPILVKINVIKERTYMEPTEQFMQVSKASLWTGRVITGLVVLFMLFDGISKVMKAQQVIDATVRIGFPVTSIVGIGITLLVCTALYVIPNTSILGAILLTGYLGGATAAQLRAGSPIFETVFPIIFGILVWLGVYLREPRVRTLVPLRS